MKRLLIIDGNYFAMRAHGQLNMGNNKNFLLTDKEKSDFKSTLFSGMVSLIKTFRNEKRTLIDNVVFCVDGHSWRKDITPHIPYHMTKEAEAGTPMVYKEQRIAVKEKSETDWVAFKQLYYEFVEQLKEMDTIVFDMPKFEGDDHIMLISEKLRKEFGNFFGVIFATDGDLAQVITDNMIMFKNNRSNACPDGEIVMNIETYTKYFEEKPQSVLDAFITQTTASSQDVEIREWLRELATVVTGDVMSNRKATRTLNNGLSIAQPQRILLQKIICGDKKDNIFSLLGWMSTTGTTKFQCSPKMFEKAIDAINMSPTNKDCGAILADKDLLITFFNALKTACKQTNEEKCTIKTMADHFKYNLRLLILTPRILPADQVSLFEDRWNMYYDRLKSTNISEELINGFASKALTQQSSTDIYAMSIPKELQ